MRVEEQLALAAGHFNGEGTFAIYRNPRLTIGQSGDPWMLEHFKRTVCAGYVNGPYRHKYSNVPIWHYQLNGIKAIHVMQLLWPYLSPQKRRQFNEAMGQKGWSWRMW